MRNLLAVAVIAIAALLGTAAAQPRVDEWWACEKLVNYMKVEDMVISYSSGSPISEFTLLLAMMYTEQEVVVYHVVNRIGTRFQYAFSTPARLKSGHLDYLVAGPNRGYWVFFQAEGGVACLIEMITPEAEPLGFRG